MAGPLLVVDAPSMLFRAFYALPKTITGPDGQPVNALLGTANLVLREVEKHRPRAVFLCCGPDAAAYRTELYPAYHAEREEAMPAELPDQFTASGPFFEAFGWTVATSDDLEADDLLGTYARREAEAGGRALILTGDRDMYQCAAPGITVLYVRTGGKGAEENDPDGGRGRHRRRAAGPQGGRAEESRRTARRARLAGGDPRRGGARAAAGTAGGAARRARGSAGLQRHRDAARSPRP